MLKTVLGDGCWDKVSMMKPFKTSFILFSGWIVFVGCLIWSTRGKKGLEQKRKKKENKPRAV
jgi:hypothetical protein